jgi:hypothetical protein
MVEKKEETDINITIDILFTHIEKIYELLGYKCLSVKRNWPEEDFKVILKKLK